MTSNTSIRVVNQSTASDVKTTIHWTIVSAFRTVNPKILSWESTRFIWEYFYVTKYILQLCKVTS